MKKVLLLIFGISLIVGLITGYLTSETKYFFMSSKVPKIEITKENYKFYNDDYDGNRYYGEDMSRFTLNENIFNTQNAIIGGLSAMGLLFIFSFFYFRKLDLNNI
jgi:hypothetical protein